MRGFKNSTEVTLFPEGGFLRIHSVCPLKMNISFDWYIVCIGLSCPKNRDFSLVGGAVQRGVYLTFNISLLFF